MIRSGHVDTFARDNLPPRDQWPEFLFTLPELQLSRAAQLRHRVARPLGRAGEGDRIALISPAETLTYAQLAERVNRIANVLTRDLGLVPGNRVLLRAPNNPMMVAAYLAVIKAGGVVVATMPLLRAKELVLPVDKAKITLALCDARLADEIEKAQAASRRPRSASSIGADGADARGADGEARLRELHRLRHRADDVCLIAFTSGTTGEPKGTMHFHRDMLAICDSYAQHVLRAEPRRPLHRLAAARLHVRARRPRAVSAAHRRVHDPAREGAARTSCCRRSRKYRATICFTAPTAYRAMLGKLAEHDISSLRKCVSAGEALPKATFEAWQKATGIKIIDGIGATEMLHIFIGSPEDEIRAGATGKAVPGYEAQVIDDDGSDVPPGTVGRLAVRGPTGCRYLADERQRKYVQNGWNVTGDTYLMDADGYFWYQARSDDMIISAGYNIAGPEVESALLTHPAVAECGVVGAPTRSAARSSRPMWCCAPGHDGDAAMARALQDHVKATIAPYKYPRAIEFVGELPKTQTGKLQRFELRRLRRRQARATNSLRNPGSRRMARNQSKMPPTAAATMTSCRRRCAAGWPRPIGLRQRHDGEGPRGRHRRRGRLGRDGQFPGRVRRAGAAAFRQHRCDARRRRRRPGASRAAHLVRRRLDEYRASLKELGRAYREMHRRALSRDGGGAGRRPGREGRTARDRGDGGRAGVAFFPL